MLLQWARRESERQSEGFCSSEEEEDDNVCHPFTNIYSSFLEMLYCLFCCCVGRRQLVIALQRMFAQIYRELLEESCCQLDKQAEAACMACVALLLSSGPWGQFLPYSEVFMGCHSLGRLPFCHQFLKRQQQQQHFSSFTVNNCWDFCGSLKTYL